VDYALHRTATDFLRSIGSKCGTDIFEEDIALEVDIQKQYKHIDVLALISNQEKKFALVIEDKTDSFMHSKQLSRYSKIVRKDFPNHEPLLVYLKTGEISRAVEAKKDGYAVYSRNDFLKVLEPNAKETKDSILRDYYQRLKCRDELYRQYLTIPPCDWKDPKLAWEGFFSELRKKMEESIKANKTYWQFVNNRSGGEFQFGAWRIVGKFGIHLQLVKKWGKKGEGRNFLAFKVGEVREKSKRSIVRDKFSRSLMKHAETNGWRDKFKKPDRLGNGSFMVIAESNETIDWLPMDSKVDLEETIEKLNGAYKLLCEFDCD